jgi:hypothetical protein
VIEQKFSHIDGVTGSVKDNLGKGERNSVEFLK